MSKKQNNYISAELEWVNFKLQELSTFLEKNKDNYKPRKVIRIVNADIHSNNKHYLYAHFTLDSEYPFYIGIGTQNNKTKLYNRACSKVGRNKMWLANTRDKPYFVLIMSSSNDYNHIKLQEIETINQYGRKIDNGILTNISIGGDGCLGYNVTIKGLSFSGFHQAQLQSDRDKVNLLLLNKRTLMVNLIIALGTLIAGLYYILEILDKFFQIYPCKK